MPTLRLFFAAFIVLGLDSYVFARLSGDVGGGCMRVWTQWFIGSGMLVVGSCTVINGIAWLAVAYLDNTGATSADHDSGAHENVEYLERLLRRSVYGITIVTVFLLSGVAYDYVNIAFVYRSRPSWVLLVVPIYVASGPTAMGLMTLKRCRDSWRSNHDEFSPTQQSLSPAITTAVLYALLGMLITGVATSTSPNSWDRMPISLFLTVLAIVLVPPAPILLVIASAMPRAGQRSRQVSILRRVTEAILAILSNR
jgi:hypothetical protein